MRYLALAICILCAQMTTQAAEARESFSSYRVAAEDSGISLDEAVRDVKNQTGGRILSARTVGRGNRKTHVVKVLLPSGKVKVVRISAR